MYLSTTNCDPTFVAEYKTIQVSMNIKTILAIIIPLLLTSAATGQQMYPGDINNNGIVNNVDALYWAVAKDATGAPRAGATTNFEAQDITELWAQDFPTGLNYAYADCDGDGMVDDPDLNVINDNLNLTHDPVTPDEYFPGIAGLDPELVLTPDVTTADGGDTINVVLSLGTEQSPVDSFYGIAFTLTFDPDVVGKQGNDFRLEISDETWMGTMGDEKPIRFLNWDKDNGIVQVAIVKKNQMPVSGFGEVANLSIVMEDIIVGIADFEMVVEDVKMVDLQLEAMPVVPDTLVVSLDSTLVAVDEPVEAEPRVWVFPNPVQDKTTVRISPACGAIENIELFDITGRKIRSLPGEGGLMQTINTNGIPRGMYQLRIYTRKGMLMHPILK